MYYTTTFFKNQEQNVKNIQNQSKTVDLNNKIVHNLCNLHSLVVLILMKDTELIFVSFKINHL